MGMNYLKKAGCLALLLLTMFSCSVVDEVFKVNDTILEHLPPQIEGATVTVTDGQASLKVANAKEGFTYHWNIVSGGGTVDAEGSVVTFTAPATEKTVKISCYGVKDERTKTAPKEYTVDVIDLMTDNALWLKADSISGVADGDDLAEWQDVGGSGNHVTEEFPSCQPSYHSNGINGKPAVKFIDNQALHRGETAGTVTAMGNRSEASFFATFSTLNVVNDGKYLFSTNKRGASGENNNFISILTFSSSGQKFLRNHLLQNSHVTTMNTAIAHNKGYIYSALFDNTNEPETKLQIWINGNKEQLNATSMNSVTGTGVVNTIVVGNYNRYATSSLNGMVGEIIILNKIVSNKKREKIERYLKEKWGM